MSKLEAPQSYVDASASEIEEAVNGCGPEGASALIPDRVFGAEFRGACMIHDWEYTKGETRRDEADARFYRNLKAAARRAPWYLRPLALLAARWYYRAVQAGGLVFYNPKPD